MTTPTPATVAVPVELIKRYMLDNEQRVLTSTEKELIGFIPKPTPRLVAVTAEQWDGDYSDEWFAAQPDLLTLLDQEIDAFEDEWSLGDGFVFGFKARIRTALGVTE